MRYFIIIISFLLAAPIFSQQKKSMEDIQKIISEVQQKYAPDKRTTVFIVSPKSEGEEVLLSGETNLSNAKSELIKNLEKEGMKVKDEIEILPAKDLGEEIYGVVNLSVATFRVKPDHQAELATQALLGSSVKLLKKSKGWFLAQTPDKYIAWIESGSFTAMNKEQISEWNSSDKIIYTKDYGFSYSQDNLNSDPVSDLVIGNILKKLGTEGDFVKVEYPDKRIAYIPNSSCEDYKTWLESRQLSAENIIKAAKTFLGVPYLWGGTSAKLMDCSGFTRTVFFLNGVFLPRDASQQVNVGIPINTRDGFNNLQPGDLLFFGKKATENSKEKITHVGIYIGNGEFIHEAGMVKINSFDKSAKNFNAYRLNQFVRAKRIIGSVGENGVEALKSVQY
ncbi:MAG: C40 family peptidase [Bacteroidetes bacterium]|nr:C40 family peptidase [Bacteroidota bacterium]